ncbi:MAG: hypothetical protein ABIE94_01200, partial [archaeon]
MKAIWKVFMVLVLAIFIAGTVSASGYVNIEYLKINGEEVSPDTGHSESLVLNRGETVDIKMKVKAYDGDVEDLQADAMIFGYRYSTYEEDLISDVSRLFDLSENDTDYITLHLKVPTKIDQKYAKLRIRVADEDGTVMDKDYQLHIIGVETEDAIMIYDYSLSPSYEVVSGRAFTALVKVKNIGTE